MCVYNQNVAVKWNQPLIGPSRVLHLVWTINSNYWNDNYREKKTSYLTFIVLKIYMWVLIQNKEIVHLYFCFTLSHTPKRGNFLKNILWIIYYENENKGIYRMKRKKRGDVLTMITWHVLKELRLLLLRLRYIVGVYPTI